MRQTILLSSFVLILQFGCNKNEQKEVVKNESNVEKPPTYQKSVSINSKTTFGYVPDEKTAIEIALKVWIPIYGKETIETEKPYHATLKNGVWIVTGSLPNEMDGGVAEAQILQKDGKVLKVIHGK